MTTPSKLTRSFSFPETTTLDSQTTTLDSPRVALKITKVASEPTIESAFSAHLDALNHDPENNIITIHGRRFKITYFNDQHQRICPDNLNNTNEKIKQIYENIFKTQKEIVKITQTSIHFDEGTISYNKESKTHSINLNEDDYRSNKNIQDPLNTLRTYFNNPAHYTLWTNASKEDGDDEETSTLAGQAAKQPDTESRTPIAPEKPKEGSVVEHRDPSEESEIIFEQDDSET